MNLPGVVDFLVVDALVVVSVKWELENIVINTQPSMHCQTLRPTVTDFAKSFIMNLPGVVTFLVVDALVVVSVKWELENIVINTQPSMHCQTLRPTVTDFAKSFIMNLPGVVTFLVVDALVVVSVKMGVIINWNKYGFIFAKTWNVTNSYCQRFCTIINFLKTCIMNLPGEVDFLVVDALVVVSVKMGVRKANLG